MPGSTAQTLPKPGATMPPVCTSASLPTTRGAVTGGGSSPRSASAAAIAITATSRSPQAASTGADVACQRTRAAARRDAPAPLLPLRGVEQLGSEPASRSPPSSSRSHPRADGGQAAADALAHHGLGDLLLVPRCRA